MTWLKWSEVEEGFGEWLSFVELFNSPLKLCTIGLLYIYMECNDAALCGRTELNNKTVKVQAQAPALITLQNSHQAEKVLRYPYSTYA